MARSNKPRIADLVLSWTFQAPPGVPNRWSMSKAKRKRYTGAVKAKVGLEALMGIKTAGQIARENQVHPVQVAQWKGVVRERCEEFFEARPAKAGESQECIRIANPV